MFREKFPGLKSARLLIFAAVAACSTPPQDVSVAQWAEQKRFVAAESGSARPGRWSNATTPYAVEPMEVCSPGSGATRVAVRASAQTLKSELILNTAFARIETRPGPMMLVLPSLNEVITWNRTKWRPNVKATPSINERVTPERSRDETASTLSFKHFTGGYLIVATAGSSKELQARSVRDLFGDELSEWPLDTKGRGDPLDQARHRQDGWGDDAFELLASTPKDLPDCRITKLVEAGDWRQYYVPCPHCGHYQLLLFDNFDAEALAPTFTCAANGCVIEEGAKYGMIAGGVWLKTYDEATAEAKAENPKPPEHFAPEELDHWRARGAGGRAPSFDLWQAYSTLKPWAKIAAEWREAKGDPTKLKTFWQQVLAKPYDGGGEAPDYEKLHARRDQKRTLGVVPFGYWIVTGAADIQSDRIEAAVWAWGPGGAGYLIARALFKGTPTDERDGCWAKLAEFRQRQFEGENGHLFGIDIFGVDAGFASYTVYRFCNARAATLALDGRGDRFMAPLGTPKHIKPAAATPTRKPRPAAFLYPVGTYGLKQRIYAGLRATIDGPDEDGVWPAGALRFPDDVTLDDMQQLTAEALMPVKKADGRTELAWRKLPGRANEMLDIAVYSRALAFHLGIDRYDREKWEELAAMRGGAGDANAGGLEKMWSAAGLTEKPAAKVVPARRGRGVRGKVI